MKLMKRIALIFISVTLISSIIYMALGKSIIDVASQGEIERGPGRTNGALGKIQGELNRITSQAREFGEYFSMADIIAKREGYESSVDALNLDKKIEKAPITNMFIVDSNFNVHKPVVTTNLDIASSDTKSILNQSKVIIDRKSVV